MIVYFHDGSSIGVPIDPEKLWCACQLGKEGYVTLTIGFEGRTHKKRDVREINEDRTFGEEIKKGYPSFPPVPSILPPRLPPDVPPDTESDWMLDADEDCGDYGDIQESGIPRSKTLPCRER